MDNFFQVHSLSHLASFGWVLLSSTLADFQYRKRSFDRFQSAVSRYAP
jgi:hypothetical protein